MNGRITVSLQKILSHFSFTPFLVVAFVVVSGTLTGQSNAELDTTSSKFEPNIQNGINKAYQAQAAKLLNAQIFGHFEVQPLVNGAHINWSVHCDHLSFLRSNGYTVVLEYNTKIGANRHKEGYSNSDWTTVPNLSIASKGYDITDLKGGTKYVFKLGISKEGGSVIWSGKASCKPDRGWGIFKFLLLIGSLGLFIFGMKMMSEGLQRAAGSGLRKMLSSITSNRLSGILTGFGITSVVQSSSVTSVMTVSFVNAGLLTLTQSAGVMMGANVGTTITGWLINVFGFKVSLSAYALIFIAVGAPFLFTSKQNLKSWGTTIIGFALLFMGLGELKHVLDGSIDADSGFVKFFLDYKDFGLLSTVLFVLLGTVVTVLIQSSSAAMALTMTLVAGGLIPFEVASAMVLGENIGTTITAQIAASIGNVHAKRSAMIHSMFNIVGVIWAVVLFSFLLKGIATFMDTMNLGDPFTDFKQASNTGLVIFHTAFNALNVIVLIAFVPQLVNLAERLVIARSDSDEDFKLDFIRTPISQTPETSILEAKKEVAKFGSITSRMPKFILGILNQSDKKAKAKLYKKIAKYEEITDRVEVEIAQYLGKVAQGQMTSATSRRIRSMLSITNDLERIGDIFYQISKTIERKEQDKIYFTPDQREGINSILRELEVAFEIMNNNLLDQYGGISLEEAMKQEQVINSVRDKLREAHMAGIEKGEFNIRAAMIYNDLFSACERVGDHIINVSEAVAGDTPGSVVST